MEPQGVDIIKQMIGLGQFGAVLSLAMAAIGSVLGAGAAGAAAVGAWRRAYEQNKAAAFILVTFVGAPLSQTIYGMILMGNINTAVAANPASAYGMIGIGLVSGLAMGFSAWYQGKCGAYAADALAETGKGFGNYLMVLGVIETVALFVMVFAGGALGN
jgi:V/A-type H+-transporting ATPase subunit K